MKTIKPLTPQDFIDNQDDLAYLAFRLCLDCKACPIWAVDFIEQCLEQRIGCPGYAAYLMVYNGLASLSWAKKVIAEGIRKRIDGSYMAGALLTLEFPEEQIWFEQTVKSLV